MVVKLQRPILVGGLGLSFSLWMLQSWHHSIVQLGELSLVSLLFVGGGLWLLQQYRPQKNAQVLNGIPVDRATAQEAIATVETIVNQLAQEAGADHYIAQLRDQLQDLTTELDRQELQLAITGGKSVGKTTLRQLLEHNLETQNFASIRFFETSPLLTEISGQSDALILGQTNTSDLVLFITNGDLTDSEYQLWQQIKNKNHNTVLVFNKQDQYLPDERESVVLALQQRLQENIVATAASPLPVKVRKHYENGFVQEWLEVPPPDIQQLTQQLSEVFSHQGQQLVWATTVRKAHMLKTVVKDSLNTIRRDRSLPVIEQYQWIAAAAAFANPVPALDLLATAAINAQMVIDLGRIYQQQFSLEQAQTIAGKMGSLMLKLGLVELSSKAISTVLKSNAVTFMAGGLVQGVSAAYLTRIAGLSLVEYFQEQEVAVHSGKALNLDKLGQTLQKVFQQSQQIPFLQGFVKQGVKRLTPESTVVESAVSDIAA